MEKDDYSTTDKKTSELKKLSPLFTLGDKIGDDECALNWAKNARNHALKYAEPRNKEISRNLNYYAGKHKHAGELEGHTARRDDIGLSGGFESGRPYTPSVTVNHLFDLTEHRVSKYMRFQPNVSVFPANSDEVEDRQKAELVGELIRYIQYDNDFDDILRTMSRRRTITGECYVFVEWDKIKGAEREALKTGLGSDLADDEKNVGDVRYRIPNTHDIFLEPAYDCKFESVDWVIERKYAHLEKLRKDYPDKKDKLEDEKTESSNTYLQENSLYDDDESNKDDIMDCRITYWELWHKGNHYLPEGRHMVFTDNCMLKNDPNPYEHKQFPFIRISDLEFDGYLYGVSIYRQTWRLNKFVNACYSMTYRNQALVGSPRWSIHENADVRTQDLGNDIVGLRWKGQIPPTLHTVPSHTPKEAFALIQDLTERQQQLFGIHGVSRGEPPAGVKAGVAMTFLNEQENERFDSEAKKHNKAIRLLWLLTLRVIRQFYRNNDKRLIKVFGKNKEYQVKRFDPAILNTKFDIRVQNQNNLPDTKAARMQYIIDIDEKRPLPDDLFFEYLDLGIPEQYIDEVSQAKKSADIENSDAMDGKQVMEPEDSQDHLAHWQRHFSFMQSCAYKEADPVKKEVLKLHLMVHEQMLMQKAFLNENIAIPLNQSLAQLLMQIPSFPAVYVPNVGLAFAPQSPMEEGMMPPPGMEEEMVLPGAGPGELDAEGGMEAELPALPGPLTPK